MSRSKTTRRRRPGRLDRIERKCDLILSELLSLRRSGQTMCGTDSLIEQLHRSAREMRRQCERERVAVRKFLLTRHREP